MSNISNDNLDNGIVVFCTNGNVMFSSNGELIENTKKARKHKNYGNVLHPPFANMLELTSSQFWVKFLNNCSKNKFPKNFSYINKKFYYKSKQKKQQSFIFIDQSDLNKTFENLKFFLKDKGILPSEEKLEIFSEREEKVIEVWKDIGKKNSSNYVYQFINNEQIKNKLNEKEKGNLYSLIKLGLAGGIFNDNTIILDGNKILKINFLLWDTYTRIYKIDKDFFDPKLYKMKKTKQINGTKNTTIEETDIDGFATVVIEKYWEKFIQDYYKI